MTPHIEPADSDYEEAMDKPYIKVGVLDEEDGTLGDLQPAADRLPLRPVGRMEDQIDLGPGRPNQE